MRLELFNFQKPSSQEMYGTLKITLNEGNTAYVLSFKKIYIQPLNGLSHLIFEYREDFKEKKNPISTAAQINLSFNGSAYNVDMKSISFAKNSIAILFDPSSIKQVGVNQLSMAS